MSLVHWLRAAALAGLLLTPATGLSEGKKAKPPDVAADKPGAVHKRMDSLAGSWDVELSYVLGGEEHKGKARCEARWILDGHFLHQEYKSKFMGRPFTVVQILGYDNRKNKTIEIIMESMSTGILHNEGTISEDGKVITNTGQTLDPGTGKPTKLRTVTSIVDRDHYALEWFTQGADGKEQKVVSMKHTRSKGGAGR